MSKVGSFFTGFGINTIITTALLAVTILVLQPLGFDSIIKTITYAIIAIMLISYVPTAIKGIKWLNHGNTSSGGDGIPKMWATLMLSVLSFAFIWLFAPLLFKFEHVGHYFQNNAPDWKCLATMVLFISVPLISMSIGLRYHRNGEQPRFGKFFLACTKELFEVEPQVKS